MPPKKKAGAKKKEKDKKKEEAETEELTELDKHYYLSQIEAQASQLAALSARCRLLEEAEAQARLRHDQLLQDKVDVTSLLRNRLKARGGEAEELQSRLRALLMKGDEERQLYEERLKEQQKTAHEEQLNLKDRLIALSRQLESLEEFRLSKDQLESQLEELKSSLQLESQQHQEQISKLERSSIQESEALKSEVELRVTNLASKFRRAAAAEMHSTTRRALHHNQALTSVLETLRARLLHLREENHSLKDQLQSAKVKEKIQKNLAEELAMRSQKRGLLLRCVTERAEQHITQHEEDIRHLSDVEQLRKDLRLQQAQLDATTELISQLKEKALERDVALELTAVRLQEEDVLKKSLLRTVRMVLSLLKTSAFENNKSGDYGTSFSSLIRQIVDLLTAAEEAATGGDVTTSGGGSDAIANYEQSDVLMHYQGGDLGLLPRSGRNRK
ncbi:cilia- and flagella-associated protein 157-like [Hyalella azteca]|uniref:Cilia- and flagella-associated protein 157 n=1 Tax=Hyalella azteca TaxID=294128 RepID=A0A979FNI2_HYAAZ|nr:cilia- and flagella-associated protein 157-like [Hyalella azteca]